MKQKSLFAAVLTGLLCLSACVKNVESPEVTALRNARADEIRANAELLRANADVQKAQAEYLKAQAAYQQARVAYVAAETEYEKALAAEKLAQAEQAKVNAKYAIELAEINHQVQMLTAQQNLANAIAQGKLNANANLLTLVNQYSTASNTLFNLKTQYQAALDAIANYEEQIEDLKAGLTDPEETNAKDIAKWQAEIARLKKQLEAIKAYQTASPKELQDKLEAARVALIQAQTDYQQKLQKENDANNAFWNQQMFVQNKTVYYQYVYSNSTYIQNYVSNGFYNPFAASLQNKYNDEKEIWEWGFMTPGTDPKFVALWEWRFWDYADDEVYPTAKDGIFPTYSESEAPTVSYEGGNLLTEGFETLYKAAKKHYEDAVAAAKALDPADPAAVEDAEEDLADFEEGWEELNANIKTAMDAKPAFDAEVKKAVDAYAAYFTAWKARIDAYIVLLAAQDEFNAIETTLYYYDETGTPRNIATEIANLENQIKQRENNIKNTTTNTANAIENLENLIAQKEELLAELEDKIAVQEKVVADLKAQLDEALAAAEEAA